MSSDAARRLLFFPTPYPDEILYSVLCRYHSRCGNPSAVQTNRELWGKHYGKRLFLPDGIEFFASQIPESSNLTAERFIVENTIFPWLKPFLPKERGENLFDALKHGNSNIYNIVAFSRVFAPQTGYLHYCRQCVEYDMNRYGEAYWHRAHQLPGVILCPVHNVLTVQSDVRYSDLLNEYIIMPKIQTSGEQSLDSNTTVLLAGLAVDALWLLQNGCCIGYLEHTSALYDRWLSVKGYRDGGKTSRKKIAQEHITYFGRELLEMFGAYNSGTCSWLQSIIQNNHSFQSPIYHALFMRFLAGSAVKFYAGASDEAPVYQPYGEPPYPCRNVVCEYHLQDVIDSIEIINIEGKYRATFVCPHCGFIYRRKKPILKEKQYSGQIDVVDYGPLWHKTLKYMLKSQLSINKTAQALRCDTRTVVKLGIELGYFPAEQYPKLRPYITRPKTKLSFNERREHYRQRWLCAIKSNPEATRNELRLIDSKADQWLHIYDADWLKKNSPLSLKSVSPWVSKR